MLRDLIRQPDDYSRYYALMVPANRSRPGIAA